MNDNIPSTSTTEFLGENQNYTDEYILDAPYIRIFGMIIMALYVMTFAIGIPANLYVLVRMRQLSSSDNERYRNGTGIALCSMAAADLCSILLICAQNIHQMTYSGGLDTESSTSITAHVMCKGMLFLTHTVTGISIWSWLLLSSLRYLAICHPLYHLRLWRMPYRALAFIIAMSALLNTWLLVSVESSPGGCVQIQLLRNSLTANRIFHFVEAIWSFCIPFVVIIVMDGSVVLKSTRFPKIRRKGARRKSALEEVIKLTRSSSDRLKRRHQKALFKWLAVALICVLLNTPENMYRLITLFGFGFDSLDEPLHIIGRMITQVLYFSQFAFNAIYLSIFVYDKSCKKRGGHPETSLIYSYHHVRSRPDVNSSLIRDDSPFIHLPLTSPSSLSNSIPPHRIPISISSSSPTRTISPLRNNNNNSLTGSLSLPTTPRKPMVPKVFPKETKALSPCDIVTSVTTPIF